MKTIQWMLGSFCILMAIRAFDVPNNTPPAELPIETNFQEFLDFFPAHDLPFELGFEELLPDEEGKEGKWGKTKSPKTSQENTALRDKASIMADYLPDAAQRKFSRMGPPEIVPVQYFATNNNLIAVIYGQKHHFISQSRRYKLALFTKQGKFLQDQLIATYSPEATQTCAIDRNGILEIVAYTNEWEKELSDFGPVDNTLIACHKEEVTFYEISRKGKIEQLKEYPTSERASIN